MPEQQSLATEATAPQWVFAARAAEILGVSRDTLIRLTDDGTIPCWRPTEKAQRRWDLATLVGIRDKARGMSA